MAFVADDEATELVDPREGSLGDPSMVTEMGAAFDAAPGSLSVGPRLGSLDEKLEAPDPADQLPTFEAQAISRLGDLWLLGRHCVFCGNALEPSAYAHVMETTTAELVFTDPPYNVPIEGHVGGLGSVHHREFPMASGEMSEAEYERFLLTCFQHLCAFSRPGSVHFICID